jgi:hypothetical protein
VAKRKRRIRKTGGGDTVSELAPDVQAVAAIIPNQMQRLENPYDSNATGTIYASKSKSELKTVNLNIFSVRCRSRSKGPG